MNDQKINEKRAQALAGDGSLSKWNASGVLTGYDHYSGLSQNNQVNVIDEDVRSFKKSSSFDQSLLVSTYEYNFRSSQSKRFSLMHGIKHLCGMMKFRIQSCMSFMPRAGEERAVHLMKSGSKLSFLNVHSCGSVWLCPVCNARISSERRKELAEAVEASGVYSALVTYTLSHSKHDRLVDLLKALRVAVNKVKSGRWYEAFLKEHEIIASVSSLEFTHGSNGWHPHIHALLFMRSKPDPEAIKSELTARFTKFISKSGYYASSIHSIDVRATRKDVSGYISKWNVIKELSDVQAKRARGSSLNVWQLAQLAINGDREAGALWLEYADASFRKKALQWSRNGREALGMDEEKSDEEINQEHSIESEREAECICSFEPEEWYFILDRGLIGEVLHQARIGGAQAVNELMIRIRGKPLREFLNASHIFTLERD